MGGCFESLACRSVPCCGGGVGVTVEVERCALRSSVTFVSLGVCEAEAGDGRVEGDAIRAGELPEPSKSLLACSFRLSALSSHLFPICVRHQVIIEVRILSNPKAADANALAVS